jgi:hypothetical protein
MQIVVARRLRRSPFDGAPEQSSFAVNVVHAHMPLHPRRGRLKRESMSDAREVPILKSMDRDSRYAWKWGEISRNRVSGPYVLPK